MSQTSQPSNRPKAAPGPDATQPLVPPEAGGERAAERPAVSARTQPVPSASVGRRPPPSPAAPAAQGSRPAPARATSRRLETDRPVRRQVVVRRVDPWSVLKLSLIFYFCALLVVMLALAVFWSVVNQLGLVDRVLDFLGELQLIVEIRAGMIARAVFLLGLLNVILWSGVNVFLAFLYNLIADLVGGLKTTLVEER